SQALTALRKASVATVGGYLPQLAAFSAIVAATKSGGANCGSPTCSSSGTFPPPDGTPSSSLFNRVKGWKATSESSRSLVIGGDHWPCSPENRRKVERNQCATR